MLGLPCAAHEKQQRGVQSCTQAGGTQPWGRAGNPGRWQHSPKAWAGKAARGPGACWACPGQMLGPLENQTSCVLLSSYEPEKKRVIALMVGQSTQCAMIL